jgi:hypothetical protein
MHVEKVRTANLPGFRLNPGDALILMSFIGITAYLLGFLLGLAA